MTKNRGNVLLISLSIMLATIMQVLDTTIANVALPHMRGSLGAGVDQVTWVLTSYIVATAIMTLPVGYLAQRHGRRNVFLWSITGFTITSMLCGQADSLTEMVVWRLLQGLFGASLVPLSQATLLDVFPREKLASAMGIWSMGIMVGPILGPTLGGWLTDTYSWRWVFYINVPLGVLAIIGIYATMPDSEPRAQRFDHWGFAFLALAVATLQLLLDRGEHVDWFESLEVQLYAVLSVLGVYLFLVHTATSEHKFFSPGLLRDRNLVAGVVFIFVTGIVMLATMALLPPFLQQWKGYPAASAGMVMMPRGIGTMISSLLVARFLRYFDARVVIIAGLGLVTVALHSMAGFNIEVGQRDIVISGFLQGLGLGLVMVPTSTLAFATLTPALRDEASGLFSLARNLGSSIGVSIVMAVLSRSLWINQQELGSRVQMSPQLTDALRSSTEGLMAVPASVINEISRQAAEVAYVNDFYMLMLINLLAMPLVLMLANPDHRAARQNQS